MKKIILVTMLMLSTNVMAYNYSNGNSWSYGTGQSEVNRMNHDSNEMYQQKYQEDNDALQQMYQQQEQFQNEQRMNDIEHRQRINCLEMTGNTSCL